MGKDKEGSILNKLRGAVKKVRFVLRFNLNSLWRLVPMIGSSSSSRRFSFNDRPGLAAACTDEYEPPVQDGSTGSSPTPRSYLYRTASYASSDEDIDKKADIFIANFYRQLKIERQISLELKYYRPDNNSSGFDFKSP